MRKINMIKPINPPFFQTAVSGSRCVPMLFSTDMVKAILNGTKTETRRIVKFSKKIKNPEIGFTAFTQDGEFSVRGEHKNGEFGEGFFKLKVCKNDIIWVRETFRPIEQDNGRPRYEYKATEHINLKDKWKPSLFMPKDACRIFLKCVSVHAERLNTISDLDAISEGISKEIYHLDDKVTIYENYLNGKDFYSFSDYSWNYGKETHSAAVASYCSLWESINGDGSWNKNPFVWVYKFVRIDRPDDFR